MVIETKTLEEEARELLNSRGVSLKDIGDLVYFLQKDYIPNITLAECIASVESVLTKREVHNTILTGIQLDILAEKGELLAPLQKSSRKMKAYTASTKSSLCPSSMSTAPSALPITATLTK